MSREDIIRRIVERESQKRGLTEEAVLQEAPDLHQAACQQFGAWDTALQYAGVSLRRLYAKPRYTREEVIRRIRTHCRRGGRPAAAFFLSHERQLYLAARQHFGTWWQVLRAAGVNLRHARLRATRPRRHDKERLLAAMRGWKAAGHSLEWRAVCLENRDLASAVRCVFGTWPRGVAAMENAPEAKRVRGYRKWDRTAIIETIRRRQQEGRPMDRQAVRRDNCGLLYAAERYLGSWGEALAAAGVALEGRGK